MSQASFIRVCPASYTAAYGALFGCAQVLGIPSDPALVPSPAAAPSSIGLDADAGSAPDAASPGDTRSEPAASDFLGPSRDGFVPPENVAVDIGTGAELEHGDAAVPGPPPQDECPGELERVPLDIVFIVDNSPGMAAANTRFEAALPGFAQRLDEEGVDYRLILLSQHRSDERDASEAASGSVCIAAPLSGLAACPSAEPALGPRFFQYSVAIDAANSLSRALATLSEPDPFGLSDSGWSEWLRLGARKAWIEVSLSDSALPSARFIEDLAAAAPAHFNADPENPGFVFHSIIGIDEGFLALGVYGPDDPIESDLCDLGGANADSAGQVYQELSRSTRGLRQSICPAIAMELRLQVLAVDLVRRSFAACP